MNLRLRRCIPAAAAFIVPLAVYIKTLCPTVWTVDSGEFALNAATLGVCHPPGYPTYCLLGKLFTVIVPIGSIVYRMNLMSAVFGALASLVVYFIAHKISGNRIAGVGFAWLLAFAPVVWSQAVVAEVWTLSLLFLSLVIWLLMLWSEEKKDRLLYAASFVYGLSLTNHLTMALFLPLILLYVFLTDRSVFTDIRRVSRLALLFLLGLIPYAYLPIRAAAHPPLVWGDPSTPSAFWHHITGKMFRSAMFSMSAKAISIRSGLYGKLLLGQFSLAMMCLIPFGVITLRRKQPQLTLMLAGIYFLGLFYAFNYRILDIDAYYIPGFLPCVLFMAAGWRWLTEHFSHNRRLQAIMAIAVLAVPVVIGIPRLQTQDMSRAVLVDEYMENVLAGVEKGGLLINCGDGICSAFEYKQFIEGRRSDVLIVDHTLLSGWDPNCGSWCTEWYTDTINPKCPSIKDLVRDCRLSRNNIVNEIPLKRLVAESITKRPVYVCCSGYSPYVPILRHLKESYELVPEGLVYRVLPAKTDVDGKRLAGELADFWSGIRIDGVIACLESKDPFAIDLVQRYPMFAMVAGRTCLSAGQLENAEKLFTVSLKLDPDSTEARHGLAVCYIASGDYRRAAKELSTLLVDNPDDKSLLRSLNAVRAVIRRQSTGNNT